MTIINPGNIATPEVQEDIATGAFGPQEIILLVIRQTTLTISSQTDPKPGIAVKPTLLRDAAQVSKEPGADVG